MMDVTFSPSNAKAQRRHVQSRTSTSAPELPGERKAYLPLSSLPLHRPVIGPRRCALFVRADADATELQGRRERVCCW